MNLLKYFITFIQFILQATFPSNKTSLRAQTHAFGALCGESPHTVTSTIEFKGTENQDWSADYKLYSRSKWSPEDLFSPLIKGCLPYFSGPYVVASIDDSIFKKTGKKIKTASWQRDPMSPHFHTNLMFGLRFLQISLTLPLYKLDPKTASRAIPVDFTETPVLKKPGKKATKKEWKAYEKKVKQYRIPVKSIGAIKKLRKSLDEQGFQDKTLITTADNAFCNKYGFKDDLDRVVRVMRCRKDVKICHKSSVKKRFYAQKKFTPEDLYKDEKIPWITAKVFRAGKYREIEYKETHNCFWQSATKRKPFTLIVLKKTPYYPRKGHMSYRDAAYLLCEESQIEAVELIQAYHDHIGIELNFKEEKQVIGVGEAQVRNENSVKRQPAFSVAVYSSLLLVGIVAYREKLIPHVFPLSSWRKDVRRPSIRMLIKQLKKELLAKPNLIHQLNLSSESIEMILKMAA